MCWACNPICGRCKPPAQRAATCTECGNLCCYSKSEVLSGNKLFCPVCDNDMTLIAHIEPGFCNACGQMCAWPCGKADAAGAPENMELGCLTPVAV